jgi:hypothetical protein
VTGIATPERHLIVVLDDDTTSHPLPAVGELIIGNGPSCHIVIANPAISPMHALLYVTPDRISVEDLGTPTGTWVRDRRIAPRLPTTVSRGEVIEIGSSLLLVKRRRYTPRLVPHSAFAHALAQVRGTAARSGTAYGVMWIRCDPSRPAAELEAALRDTLHEVHHTGYYAPGHYAALMVDTGIDQLRHRALQVEAALRARGIRARVDAADRPADARYADADADANANANAELELEPAAPAHEPTAHDPAARYAATAGGTRPIPWIAPDDAIAAAAAAPAITAYAPSGRRTAMDIDDDRRRILDALNACGGNQTQAAQRLGISRRTLINRMLEYGLPRPRRGTRNPDRA